MSALGGVWLPSPEEWVRVGPLLDEVLDLPPEQQAARLAAGCGNDVALRAHLERILAADAGAGSSSGSP